MSLLSFFFLQKNWQTYAYHPLDLMHSSASYILIIMMLESKGISSPTDIIIIFLQLY